MTPELPRAPIRAPRGGGPARRRRRRATVDGAQASAAARMVIDMLVPVSPSGTGEDVQGVDAGGLKLEPGGGGLEGGAQVIGRHLVDGGAARLDGRGATGARLGRRRNGGHDPSGKRGCRGQRPASVSCVVATSGDVVIHLPSALYRLRSMSRLRPEPTLEFQRRGSEWTECWCLDTHGADLNPRRGEAVKGRCEICGKTVAFGHNVSHSNRKTNRMLRPTSRRRSC